MGLWNWLRGKQLLWVDVGLTKVGETKPAPVQNVIIEFVCTTPGCKFETLSLTDAQEHIRENLQFEGGFNSTQSHNLEPRGYLYPPKEATT